MGTKHQAGRRAGVSAGRMYWRSPPFSTTHALAVPSQHSRARVRGDISKANRAIPSVPCLQV